ncbi:MAG: hypothetical protein HY219_02255 [Candidatus Staskawiczbacteria bacterium]|nr:hypothetical protein [Candidatus Staskawiczbacteria bacterium]
MSWSISTWQFLLLFFLGSLPLPIPSTTVLVASAAFAAQGYINFYAVLAVGVVGNFFASGLSVDGAWWR